MARDRVTVDQLVNDFVLTSDGDDFVAGVSNTVIRNFALRGIREMGFDMLKRIRSIKISVGANNTAELPEDFVDYTKIGTVGGDGLVYVFGENKNLNYSQKYDLDAAGNKIDSDGDGVYDRVAFIWFRCSFPNPIKLSVLLRRFQSGWIGHYL